MTEAISMDDYKRRIANLAIAPGTLRNPGARGVPRAVREFLVKMDLDRFSNTSLSDFQRELNEQTEKLRTALPEGAKHWGIARKAINIYLFEAFYHKEISRRYKLESLKHFLEVPLDSQTSARIKSKGCTMENKLERDMATRLKWNSIKGLSRDDSEKFQWLASRIASSMGCDRVELELFFWGRDEQIS